MPVCPGYGIAIYFVNDPGDLVLFKSDSAGLFGEFVIAGSILVDINDQLTAEEKAASPFAPGFWDSHGWGFGLSVITQRDGVGPSSGSFGWDGGFHTSCYVDPQEDMIGILLAQRLMASASPSDFYTDFWTLAYQAIDE